MRHVSCIPRSRDPAGPPIDTFPGESWGVIGVRAHPEGCGSGGAARGSPDMGDTGTLLGQRGHRDMGDTGTLPGQRGHGDRGDTGTLPGQGGHRDTPRSLSRAAPGRGLCPWRAELGCGPGARKKAINCKIAALSSYRVSRNCSNANN